MSWFSTLRLPDCLSGRSPLASSIAGILVFKRKDSLRHRSSLYYRSGARLRTYRCARRTILCNNLLETENAIFSPQACLPFSRKILAFECTTSPRRLLRSRDAGLVAMPPAQIIFPGRSDIPTGGIIIKMNNLNAAECLLKTARRYGWRPDSRSHARPRNTVAHAA